MGIYTENIQSLRRWAPAPRALLELGNQYIYVDKPPWPEYPASWINPDWRHGMVAKVLLSDMGYDHVSIDINGRDGVLQLDLRTPFDLERKFGVVTDFGTSEHVEGLEGLRACLFNTHKHLEPDGFIIHANPLPGHWPEHGYWYRDEAFYTAYTIVADYQIREQFRLACTGNAETGMALCTVLQKTGERFPDMEDFAKLPIKTK